ncbi:MAG: TlpA family protein disulfide reductase [Propionibacteriales bacterium]|nr:TlpA family protein disulfide reductase [Propionibacteriales bacterium]
MRACARFTVVTLGAALAVAGCSQPSTQSSGTPYTFDAQHAAVRVDTSELRRQKAEAGIDPCPKSATDVAVVDSGLPDLTLPCLGGGRDVRLAGLRGTPMVLNLWAYTCGPCRAEAPLFQRLHEAAGNELAVIGVDWQDSRPGDAIAFAAELNLRYPQLADPSAATRAPLYVSALPMTLFVDAEGAIVHVEYGALPSARVLAGLVDTHLGVGVDMGAS